MSADLLLEAASLMRKRAEYAPDAPWTADILVDGGAWVRFAEPDDDVSMHGYPAAARHIASWHPAVALAVADWLDAEAQQEVYSLAEFGHRSARPEALKVAAAYLGRDS